MKYKPRLCIVGNLLGINRGYVTTQGQIIAERIAEDGFEVITVSSRINKAARLFDILWTIARDHRKIDVQIIEVYSGRAFLLADVASFLSRSFGIPTVMVLHGGGLPNFAKMHMGRVRRVLGRGKAVIAPSSFLVSEMSRFGIEVDVIPNVVDLDGYEYRKRRIISPRLLWMRSFHEDYNPHMAVDVFSSIKNEHPDASLVMAGVDKGLESNIKRMVNEMGLNDAVRFPGFLDHKMKAREFSQADIFLNTNRVDNMPVAVLEACAMGLPVVATCVGGIPHLLQNGVSGLLVPDGDPAGMVGAIDSLLKNPELVERISLNGRALAERSSWENVRTLWLDLFDEIGREKRPSLYDLHISGASNP